jgi:hypothetical protein
MFKFSERRHTHFIPTHPQAFHQVMAMLPLRVHLEPQEPHSIIVTGENAMKRWRVPYEIVAQRPGDVASCHADPATAVKLLGGQAEFRSERIRAERGRWQEKNALGFKD